MIDHPRESLLEFNSSSKILRSRGSIIYQLIYSIELVKIPPISKNPFGSKDSKLSSTPAATKSCGIF